MRFGHHPLVRLWLTVCVLLGCTGLGFAKQDANKPDEARLKPAYRFQRDGWTVRPSRRIAG